MGGDEMRAFDSDMKGNVGLLASLVDSYIADLTNALTDLTIEGMAAGSLPVHKIAKKAEIENRLAYVIHQKDKALYLDADFIDMGKSIDWKVAQP